MSYLGGHLDVDAPRRVKPYFEKVDLVSGYLDGLGSPSKKQGNVIFENAFARTTENDVSSRIEVDSKPGAGREGPERLLVNLYPNTGSRSEFARAIEKDHPSVRQGREALALHVVLSAGHW